MTTNELTKHNEVKAGYHIDNLKYCEFSDRLYAGAVSSLYHLSTSMTPLEQARGPHPGLLSHIVELGIPEYGMGIKRNVVTTDRLSPLSIGLRIGAWAIGGSPVQDGILVCKVDERVEPEIAHSVDFEVHKHMEL